MGELLKDKYCMVTGASRGIGRKIAEVFAAEGAIVYVSARTEGCLDEWAYQINVCNIGQIIPVYFDVSQKDEIKNAILKLKKGSGCLDVLVNNAAMIRNELMGMISWQHTREMFEVNVFGLLELSQLVAVKLMRPNKKGSIINMASIVGVEGSRGQVAYSASKGAVISITKSMAKELAKDNIRVNAVAPGMVDTERLQITIKEKYRENIPEIGMKRLATTKEIANACLYFASDLSTYTTGQVMVVGGGNGTLSREFYNITYQEENNKK